MMCQFELYRIDIRFYNAKTGVLENVFSDIVDSKTGAEISCCCLDDRHRKLIVGDAVVRNIYMYVYIYRGL